MPLPRPERGSPTSQPRLDAEGLGRSLLSVSRPELRELVRRRPWRVWLDVAGCYFMFVVAFALLAVYPQWWVAAVAFVLIGNRQYALSILAHDGGHRKLFQKRSTNDFFTKTLLCAPVGVDFHRQQLGIHADHHRLFASDADPDRYLYSVDDKATPSRFLLFLTGLTMFLRALRKPVHRSELSVKEPFSFASFLAHHGYTIVAQAFIFVAISRLFPWWYYLVFWMAPFYPLAFVPHAIRRFCEHAQPVMPDEDADDRRLVTFVPGWIERQLLSPYNMNFHAEHHLWPFVPYYNIPRLHGLIAGHPQFEVRRSYCLFILDFLGQLPLKLHPAPLR